MASAHFSLASGADAVMHPRPPEGEEVQNHKSLFSKNCFILDQYSSSRSNSIFVFFEKDHVKLNYFFLLSMVRSIDLLAHSTNVYKH
jgi:hypothetical protein